jgi:hypothetical protein
VKVDQALTLVEFTMNPDYKLEFKRIIVKKLPMVKRFFFLKCQEDSG